MGHEPPPNKWSTGFGGGHDVQTSTSALLEVEGFGLQHVSEVLQDPRRHGPGVLGPQFEGLRPQAVVEFDPVDEGTERHPPGPPAVGVARP